MNLSPGGVAFIQRCEGFAAHVYDDNGHQAIGYGHRLQPGDSFPGGIAQDEATKLLIIDSAPYEVMLNARVPKTCTQNQFDALVSFCYNVQNQPKSLDELLAHGWEQVPVQILRWDHAGGVVLPGLAARRQEESALFQKDSVDSAP